MIVVAFVLCTLGGWVAWTFVEYWGHRWMDQAGPARDPLRRDHREHHAHPDNLRIRLTLGYIAVFVTVSAAVGVGAVLLGGPLAGAPLLGWALGGVGYSWIHWRAHNSPRPARWDPEQRIRLHHLHHHFVDTRVNFGFSTSLWDRVFGTRRPPGPFPAVNTRAPAWLGSGGI